MAIHSSSWNVDDKAFESRSFSTLLFLRKNQANTTIIMMRAAPPMDAPIAIAVALLLLGCVGDGVEGGMD
jgi:hypothetical protein